MTNYPTKKLGEVLELCDSGTWGDELSGGMPLLRSTNMQNGELVLGDVKYINVPKEKVERYTLREGDILITKSSGSVDHIGKSLFITKEMDGKYGFSNFTQRLRVDKKQVLPKWVYLKISNPATRDFLSGASQTTTGLRNLKIPALKELEIPLPLLSEQKKIVAKLERVLAKISEAKKLRAEARENADKLLPAELHKIFGSTSSPQAPRQHSNILENVRMSSINKNDWQEKELGEICEKTSRINWNTHENFQYIDLTSVSRENFSITETKQINSEDAPSRAKKIVKTNDVIFGTTRPTLMRVTIIPLEYNNHICSTGFIVLRAKEGRALPQFIYYFIRSEQFMNRMENIQTGASYPAVSDAKVLGTKIPLPPIAEQKKIVARLDSLSEKIGKIKNLQSATQNDFTAIEQSVLSKAFSAKQHSNILENVRML